MRRITTKAHKSGLILRDQAYLESLTDSWLLLHSSELPELEAAAAAVCKPCRAVRLLRGPTTPQNYSIQHNSRKKDIYTT